MFESDGDNDAPISTRKFDGISCVGSMLMFSIILFIMGTITGGVKSPEGSQNSSGITPTYTPTLSALAQTTATATALLTSTNTPSATPTNTATLTPTETATATETATSTEEPTELPASATSESTATATLIPLPTPTQTPLPLPTPEEPFSWTLKVPVLMYHYISIPPENADDYRIGLSVSPEDFRQQMSYLAESGYHTIDLYDLSLAITNKRELPSQPVIITIDDGYRDNYYNAFPILQEFGLTATIFLATDFTDQGHEGYLSWSMIEEMSASGIRFEPHTKTHPDLRERSRDFLIYQILGSQETIAAHIGYTPRYFAYPSGRYDEAVIQVLQEIGFWGAVTTMGGKWHGFPDRFEWTRLRVRNNTPLPEFIDLVAPGDTLNGRPIEQN